MQADLVFVGDELLTGLVENTSGGYLSRRLWSAGITVREQRLVADETASIVEALDYAMQNSDIVICAGGLGPTDDDLTRDAAAKLLKRPLVLNEQWLNILQDYFAGRGYRMPESNVKQAWIPEGSRIMHNSGGTAPGLLMEQEDKLLVLLPGPPGELQPIFEEQVLPLLKSRLSQEIYVTKTLKCVGLGESQLEEKIKALGEWEGLPLTLVSRGFEVHLQLKSRGTAAEAFKEIERKSSRLRKGLGKLLYGEDEDTLAGAAATLLKKYNLSLGVAESCSGGALADMITDIPGSSTFFRGSVTAYSAEAKRTLLRLDSGLLLDKGTVSREITEAMAYGICEILNTQIGLATTGVAGPGSDEKGRPPGLVFVALVREKELTCRSYNFKGSRRTVKERAAQAALALLYETLSG